MKQIHVRIKERDIVRKKVLERTQNYFFLFKRNKRITPLDHTGKMILIDDFPPILGITAWDILGLLWTYAHRPLKEMMLEEQIKYKTICSINTTRSQFTPFSSQRYCTFSKKMPEQVIRCMFGASILCPVPVNKESTKSRVKNMRMVQLASDVQNALTKTQLVECTQPLGSCAESITGK